MIMMMLMLLSIFGIDRSSRRRCSIKKVLLKIWQNSQENVCARASFLIKWQAFLYPLKTSGNLYFSVFSGGIEKDQWYEMGRFCVLISCGERAFPVWVRQISSLLTYDPVKHL